MKGLKNLPASPLLPAYLCAEEKRDLRRKLTRDEAETKSKAPDKSFSLFLPPHIFRQSQFLYPSSPYRDRTGGLDGVFHWELQGKPCPGCGRLRLMLDREKEYLC
ncbi:mCG10509, isoform CRA_c [Mus musculus]|nr:mCG10509, isoform CRA_c [Mus musculus]